MTSKGKHEKMAADYCEHGNRPPCALCVGGTAEGESSQEKNIRRSRALIEHVGGSIDKDTGPYKQFEAQRHDRFYIQKGRLEGQDVVFKVGETANSERLEDESRNLRVLKTAEEELGSPLDIHIVQQVGESYENEGMTGLATEYLEDDKELKAELSGGEKVAIIGRVIEDLQRLPVSENTMQESSLVIHDAETISREGQHFTQVLQENGFFDDATAEQLKELFQSAQNDLADEQMVFVHGDAHGDNIFVQRQEDSELDLSLLDIEGLRISNRYHDWSEILNKAAFLQHVEQTRPDLYTPVEKNIRDMWLDSSVEFDEEAIIRQITGGDKQQVKNFRVTKVYDMLTRIMDGHGSDNPFEQERVELYKKLITDQVVELLK